MRVKIILALLLLFGAAASPPGHAQLASPFSNSVWPAQSFTDGDQLGATIQLNGLMVPSTVGSSFASGTVSVTGTSLASVTFSVYGSSDNGATFYPLPLYTQSSPGSSPTLTITATENGLYQFSLAGITHVYITTLDGWDATNVSFVLTASPNASIAHNSSGGGGVVSWPPSGDIVVSNGSDSPDGLAEVDGTCAYGTSGTWTASTECVFLDNGNTFTGNNVFQNSTAFLKSVGFIAPSGEHFKMGNSANIGVYDFQYDTTSGQTTISLLSAATINVTDATCSGTCTGFGGGSFTAAGDLSGTSSSQTVVGINTVKLSTLATGILKNTTSTGHPSIATAGTDYVAPSTTVNGHSLASNVVVSASDLTTGTVPSAQLPAATTSVLGAIKPDGTSCTTTAGVLSCTGVGGGITALTGDATASGSGSVVATVKGINSVILSSLATGIYKFTAGVPSVATAGTDYVAPGASTTYSLPQNFPGGTQFNGGVDSQTGTSYTMVASDENSLLLVTPSSSAAITLPPATTTGFGAGAVFHVMNGAASFGTILTITSTSTIIGGDSSTTIVVPKLADVYIVSDGTKYYVPASVRVASAGAGGAVFGSGTIAWVQQGDAASSSLGWLNLAVANTPTVALTVAQNTSIKQVGGLQVASNGCYSFSANTFNARTNTAGSWCSPAAGVMQANNNSATPNALGIVQAGLYQTAVGTQITAASTITPTLGIHHITGATVINTITPPANFASGTIGFIPDDASGQSTGTSGNIALATTMVKNRLLIEAYDGTAGKWYPSY